MINFSEYFEICNVPCDVGVAQIAESKLTEAAVNWIFSNKDKYIIPRSKESLFSQQRELRDFLKEFTENFLNNPYEFSNSFYQKDSDLIRSKHIVCYMVKINTSIVPIGALKELIDDASYVKIIKKFLEDSGKCYIEFLKVCTNQVTSLCPVKKENGEKATGTGTVFKTFFWLSTLFLSAKVIIEKLVLGIEWRHFNDVFEKCGTFLKTIGFMSGRIAQINHNSFLTYFYFVLYVLCVIILPFALVYSVRGLRILAHKSRGNGINASFQRLGIDAKKFVKSLSYTLNPDEIDVDAIAEEFVFSHKTCNSLKNKIAKFDKTAMLFNISFKKFSLPSFPKTLTVFLLLLAISNLGILSKTPRFIESCNNCQQKISILADKTKAYTLKKYSVRESKRVYALPDVNSIEVYTLPVGSTYTILRESENSSQIRFLTEYGYLSGWILEASHSPYSPDTSVIQAPILEVTVSSSSRGDASMVGDGYPRTCWSAGGDNNGVGEYFDATFTQETPINAIMLRQATYNTSAYTAPSSYTLEFYNSGKLIEKLSFRVEDTTMEQFIHINKSIKADKLRIIISDIFEKKFYNATVSEFAIYSPAAE